MKKAIISKAKEKRLEAYALIRKEFEELMSIEGSQRSAVINDIKERLKISTSKIYKALKG